MLKLDSFFGVLFFSSLCRLTLLFRSVCFLLLHGHRHPYRVFWRDCCRVHCHNFSHDRVPGRCHDLHHGIHLRGRGLRHGPVSRLLSQSVTTAAVSVVVLSSAIPNTIPTTVAGDLSAL